MEMTPLLRIEMIAIAIAMIAIVIYSVNRKKICIQYSLVWIVSSLAMLIVAVFPEIVFFLCKVLDIETPTNLLYLAGILVLFLISFSQTVIISKQNERIKLLTQAVSLEKYEREKNQNAKEE